MTSTKETLNYSYGERVKRNRDYILNSEPTIMVTKTDSKRSRLISLLSQLVNTEESDEDNRPA